MELMKRKCLKEQHSLFLGIPWVYFCLVLWLVISTPSFAEDAYKESPVIFNGKTNGDFWRGEVYEPGGPDYEYGNNPALLCFSRNENSEKKYCSKLIEHMGTNDYPFQSVKSVDFLDQKQTSRHNLALVSAIHYGTNEPMIWLSIWELNGGGASLIKIDKPIILAGQSEHKVFICRKSKSMGTLTLATADRIWDADKEALYGSHYYSIAIYSIDSIQGSIAFVRSYKTLKVYDSEIFGSSNRILESEAASVKKLCR